MAPIYPLHTATLFVVIDALASFCWNTTSYFFMLNLCPFAKHCPAPLLLFPFFSSISNMSSFAFRLWTSTHISPFGIDGKENALNNDRDVLFEMFGNQLGGLVRRSD